MPDVENVIKGLEICSAGKWNSTGGRDHTDCPYYPAGYTGCTCKLLMRDALALLKAQEPITGETSDGYHTFNELYHHRAVLFSVIVANYPDRAWKSKKHHDGTMYDNMFIVGIDTPDGQATYHYDVDPYWDMFKCRVLDNAPEWDGHTPAQAIERIGKLKALEPRVMTLEYFDNSPDKDSKGCLVAWVEYRRDEEWAEYWENTCDEWSVIRRDDFYSGESYRFWTSRPTDEQRETIPWN